MSTRQSLRTRGVKPEFSGLSDSTVGRRQGQGISESTSAVETPSQSTGVFSFASPKPRLVASDPVKGSENSYINSIFTKRQKDRRKIIKKI